MGFHEEVPPTHCPLAIAPESHIASLEGFQLFLTSERSQDASRPELFYGTMNFQKMQKPRRAQGRLPSEKADIPNTSARRLPCRRPANRMIDHPTDDDVPEDCGFALQDAEITPLATFPRISL